MNNNMIPNFEFFRGRFYRAFPNGVLPYQDEELTCTETYSELVLASQTGEQVSSFTSDILTLFVTLFDYRIYDYLPGQ